MFFKVKLKTLGAGVVVSAAAAAGEEAVAVVLSPATSHVATGTAASLRARLAAIRTGKRASSSGSAEATATFVAIETATASVRNILTPEYARIWRAA